MSAHWIANATKHKGLLHKSLHVAMGKTIPKSKLEAAASKSGKVGKRARLALTLEKMKH